MAYAPRPVPKQKTVVVVRQAVQPLLKAKRCRYRILPAATVTCPYSSVAERFLGKKEVSGPIPDWGSTVPMSAPQA